MYNIDYDKQRQYATQNNWLLDPDAPAPNYPAMLGLVALIDMEKAPVFDHLNKEYWKQYFSGFSIDDLRHHLMDLGYHPGKNRGALVSKLCIHYRKAVGA